MGNKGETERFCVGKEEKEEKGKAATLIEYIEYGVMVEKNAQEMENRHLNGQWETFLGVFKEVWKQ